MKKINSWIVLLFFFSLHLMASDGKMMIYNIYLRSYFDGRHQDGVGDLQGVIDKFPELEHLGINAILLSPVFESSNFDYGYDIKNYFQIDSSLGDLQDLKKIMTLAHQKNIKVFLDIAINHTSHLHPWFLASSNFTNHDDVYIWKKEIPNNWHGFDGSSAWYWHEGKQAYYYAHFSPYQPDLNFRSSFVRDEIKKIFHHWIAFGIDGFRLDAINTLYEADLSLQNPWHWTASSAASNNRYGFQIHQHDLNQPETLLFLSELKHELKVSFPQKDIFFVGEVIGNTQDGAPYYGEKDHKILNSVFAFELTASPFETKVWNQKLTALYQNQGPDFYPTFLFSNHDRIRYQKHFPDSTRHPSEYQKAAKLLALLQMTLKGIAFIYYGEEMAMPYEDLSFDQMRDPLVLEALKKQAQQYLFFLDAGWQNFLFTTLTTYPRFLDFKLAMRDGARLPMLWDQRLEYGGFSKTTPWIETKSRYNFHDGYEQQKNDPQSILNFYKALIDLRKNEECLKEGSLTIHSTHQSLVHFDRIGPNKKFTIIANLSNHSVRLPPEVIKNKKLILSNFDPTSGLLKALPPYGGLILSSP